MQTKHLLRVCTPSGFSKLAAQVSALEDHVGTGWLDDPNDPFDMLVEEVALDDGDMEASDVISRYFENNKVIDQLREVIHLLSAHVGGNFVSIGKFHWESEADWKMWRGKRISPYEFGNLLGFKSLLDFFPMGAQDSLSKLLKQPQKTTDVHMYGLPEARVVASFQQILGPGFGANSGLVQSALSKPDKWVGTNGPGGLQKQLMDHAALVNAQIFVAMNRWRILKPGNWLVCVCNSLLGFYTPWPPSSHGGIGNFMGRIFTPLQIAGRWFANVYPVFLMRYIL